MKTTCIRHPERNPLLLFRKWQIEFSDGNFCAAALLSFFEFFHNYKLEQSERASLENDVAERHGEARAQNESLQQFYTYKDLEVRLLGLYSDRSIAEAVRLLVEKGAISVSQNPNPRYKFDKTNFYLFHPEVCNQWLEEHYFSPAGGVNSGDESFEDTDINSPVEHAANASGNISASIPAKFPDRERNISSRSGKISSPSRKISRAITRDYIPRLQTQKNTATTSDCSPEQQITAAVDPILGKELSANQLSYLKQCLEPIAQAQGYEMPKFLEEVTHVLLDPTAFSQAGQNFQKKLNTLLKMIRAGKWTKPAALILEQQEQTRQQEIQLKNEWSSLLGELRHWQGFLEQSKQRPDKNLQQFSETEINRAQRKIEEFQMAHPEFSSDEPLPFIYSNPNRSAYARTHA